MSRDTRVDALVANGFAATDATSRADLMTRVEEGFRTACGKAPSWAWWVPGRLEIFGKHTDYAGGRSLLATVPRGFVIAAAPRADRAVRVIDTRAGATVVIEAAADASATTGWGAYVGAGVRRLTRDFPGIRIGADLVIASDLPRAAGLSSSSALVVAVAVALVRSAGLEDRSEWWQVIRSPLDLATYLSCIENGQSFRELADAAGVGTEGGSEDHTAMVACRADTVSQFGFVPVRHDGDARLPPHWQFVVATSGVRAPKTGAVRDRYNRASRMVRALLGIWNDSAPWAAQSLGAALTSRAHAAAQLTDRLRHGADGDFATEELVARLDHFVREDGRVPAARAAFELADARALSGLSRESQADAETLLRNQVPETVDLVESARACGAFAASSFGAGFGGSAWALVGIDAAEKFGRAWTTHYRSRHPHLPPPEWFPARPSLPLTELTGLLRR